MDSVYEIFLRERYLFLSLFILWFVMPVSVGALLSWGMSFVQGRARLAELNRLTELGPVLEGFEGRLPSAAVKVRRRRDRGTRVVPTGVAVRS